MLPSGATRTSEGWLKMPSPSPATPAMPRLISNSPSSLNLCTWWPIPIPPRASVTQTLFSASTKMPWGQTNMPAPKLFSRLPSLSKSRTGGTSSLPTQEFWPHLSATQMFPLPSWAGKTALVEPQVLSPPSLPHMPSTAVYGFGAWFWASAGPWNCVISAAAAP